MPEIFETDVESMTRCEPEDVEYNNYEECIVVSGNLCLDVACG